MKIACIYPGSQYAAWSVSEGIVYALRQMGHTAIAFARGREGYPPLTQEILLESDLIFFSGLEHLVNSKALFSDGMSAEDWAKLPAPKCAWYHESFFRDDVNLDFKAYREFADHHFFPASQDADLFNQEHFGAKGRCHWLPFGVDLTVFHPPLCSKCRGKKSEPLIVSDVTRIGASKQGVGAAALCDECYGSGFAAPHKDIPVGFIGLIYGKRKEYLIQLLRHLRVPLHLGKVQVEDIDGVNLDDTVLRLAYNYCRCQIFLNLPSLSRLLVTKVLEVMACGTLLVTPVLDKEGEANMALFEHTKHLIYYKPTNMPFINQLLREQLARPEQCAVIGLAGMAEVRKNHNLTLRMEQIFSTMGLEQSTHGMVRV